MFAKLLHLKPAWIIIIYLVLDALCIGMGMGVPIVCILFGFLAGWFLVGYLSTSTKSISMLLPSVLRYAVLMAGVTFLAMLLLWAPAISWLFDPARDLADFGIPLILYEPKASFIGWLLLMIIISPFLQLLTIVFGSYLALLGWSIKSPDVKKMV